MTDIHEHVHSPTSRASAPFCNSYRDHEANSLNHMDNLSDSMTNNGQLKIGSCENGAQSSGVDYIISPPTPKTISEPHSPVSEDVDSIQLQNGNDSVVTDVSPTTCEHSPTEQACPPALTSSSTIDSQGNTTPADNVAHVSDNIQADSSHMMNTSDNEEGHRFHLEPDAADITDLSSEDNSHDIMTGGDDLFMVAKGIATSNSNEVESDAVNTERSRLSAQEMTCHVDTPSLSTPSSDELAMDQMFCLTCHEHVRSPSSHETHKTVEAATALTNQKNECDAFLDKSVKCAAMASQWTDHMTELRDGLIKTRKSIAVEIDDMFRGIEHKLQERKMVLFTQLTDFSCDKECYLDDQLNYMEVVQQQLEAIANQVTQVKEDVADLSHITSRCHMLQDLSAQLEQETAKVKSFSLSKNTHLQFDRNGIQQLRRGLNSLALVSSSNVVPSKCIASGEGLHKAQVNKQTIIKVTPKNCQGQVEREKCLALQAELYNEEIHVECQCMENSNGTYNILYIAPQAGRYKLAVKLFQQQIKGSPFSINVSHGARVTFSKSTNAYELKRLHQQDSKLSSPSSPSALQIRRHSRTEVVSPRSLSSAESFSSLKILPSSPNSHSACSTVLPPHGDYLAAIGQYGRKKGDLNNPQGVTVDADGRVYCSDSTNQNIQVFTDNGMFIHAIGKKGRLAGHLLRPIGLCHGQDGCLIFSDYENKCINVFRDGAFVRRIGLGKLIGPKGVTCTPSGTIIVADNKGNQVLEFSIDGKLLRKYGASKSDKAVRFAGPHYVAVSRSGDVYVSDFHNHCVKVFDKNGAFLRSFGQHGSGNGQFNAPTGLSIDGHGHIVVSDWGNSRLQIFDEEGSFLTHVDTSAAPLFGPQSVHAVRDNEVLVADSGNHCVKVFRYDVL